MLAFIKHSHQELTHTALLRVHELFIKNILNKLYLQPRGSSTCTDDMIQSRLSDVHRASKSSLAFKHFCLISVCGAVSKNQHGSIWYNRCDYTLHILLFVFRFSFNVLICHSSTYSYGTMEYFIKI